MSAETAGTAAAGNGQHYESFVVRVLLNDDGSIRDTRMEHIGTGEVKRWAGWEHDAMLGFIKEAAVPPVLLAAPVGPLDAEPPVTVRAPTTPSPPAQPEASQDAAGPRAADASPPGFPAPVVRLRSDRTLLRAAQPFALNLGLDLTGAAPEGDRLIYSAVIVARQLGGKSGMTLASPTGLLTVAGSTTITIDARGLPPGTYLLEAVVSLRAAGTSRADVAAMAEGIMVQVVPS